MFGACLVDSRKARMHVSSQVIVVLAKLRSPDLHAGFFLRIRGSVPMRLVSVIHRVVADLYVALVVFSTEDRYIACAPRMSTL